MPEKKHLTPWSTDREFLQVASWIFSENSTLHRKAIDTMNMWRSRLPPSKISRSIICTIDLLNSERECEHGLSLSLMRFVSLLADEEQDRNKFMFATPLYSSGTNAGIPLWIIDLRNNIAHNTLPKLPILQAAHDEALRLLQENFWTPNIKAYHELQNNIDDEYASLLNLIVEYQQENFQLIRINNTDNKKRIQTLKPICTKICNMMKNESLCIRGLELLLSTGYLIPSDEQVKVLKIKESSNSELPSKIISFWIYLLKYFKDCGIVAKLIEKTVELLYRSDQRHLVGWTIAWLKAIQYYECRRKTLPLSKCIDDSVIKDIRWYRLLHMVVLENVTSLNVEIAQLTIKLYKPALSSETQASLLETCNLMEFTDSNIIHPKCLKHSCASDKKSDNPQIPKSELNLKRTKHYWWTRDDSLTNWSNYPFGTCPQFDAAALYVLIDKL